jgi:hypothetical protein
MNIYQIIFLISLLIGGTLVLVSYVIGLKGGKNADALWGGTPKKIRGVYTISMLVSAISYFITTVYIFLLMNNSNIVLPLGLSFHSFTIIYSILLICSMLWVPLVNLMIKRPSKLIWLSIRSTLLLVGLCPVTILLILLTISNHPTGILYISSILGISIFIFHTLILDALIWPIFWKR